MKLFIKKIILFSAFPFCLFILLNIVLNFINNRALTRYKSITNVNSIFIGDSHVQTGINDGLLLNSINLAVAAESPFFSFFKLGPILKNNHSFKKVYLGFSYHTISSYFDDYIFKKYAKDIPAKYFYILPLREKIEFMRFNSNKLSAFFKNIFSDSFNDILVSDRPFSFLGGYENTYKATSANKESMDNRLRHHFFEGGKTRGFSRFNINYLDKIIALCKKEKVELIILNLPVHPYYKNGIPQIFIEKYQRLIKQKELKVISFENLIFSDSCFTPNGDHLSQIGASLVTAELSKKDF